MLPVHDYLCHFPVQVGHTHDLLDASWGNLSLYVYGPHSRGDSRRDILDWDQLDVALKTAFNARLKHVEHIQGTYDWDSFVAPYIHHWPGKLSNLFSVPYPLSNYTMCAR